jgi:methylenetetrahydrofolate reductase (NADPH)
LIERDPEAGVEIACDLVQSIRATNSFDGVHLIPLGRYREVAHRVEQLLAD